MDTMTCTQCKNTKPLDAFVKCRRSKHGYKNPCKECKNAKRRNPDLPILYVSFGGYEYKRCADCTVYKVFSDFSRNSVLSRGVNSYCKVCASKKKRVEYATNPKVREQKRDWERKNANKHKQQEKLRGEKYRTTEKYKETRAKYVSENRDKVHMFNKLHSKKRVDELQLSYVKQVMTKRHNMPASSIPDELALAYKEVMKLKRLVKETLNEERS